MRLAIAIGLLATVGLRADEPDQVLAKQRATAAELWKKMAFEKPAPPVETANLIVYANQPEARTKALAATLDRQFVTAARALEYKDKGPERPWPGKLAVYLLPDRTEFGSFLRHAEKRSPEAEESGSVSLRGDAPHVVSGAARGEKTNTEQQASTLMITALLKKTVNGDPPEWFVNGFVEATVYRATTTSRAVNPAFRNPVARVPIKELWGEALAPEAKAVYSTLLVDYLAYGPASDKFVQLATALKSAETGGSGNLDEALETVQLNQAALEAYAKAWKKPVPVKPMLPKK